MDSDKFLQQIADYYCGDSYTGDLADVIFVLPNKRSAMFLRRYIQQRADGYAFMPRFTTFGKFIARRSSMCDASRNERLFTLYNAYRAVLSRHGRPEQAKDFDKFVFWGDMILSDFDQIDLALASAAKLYTNLRDMREISADYLSEEQKEVIRDIWGETRMTDTVETFWRHTGGRDIGEVTRRFIDLWQILSEVYDEFRSRLRQAGLATEGMQARAAVEQIKAETTESLRRNRFVFVGHADLSAAHIKIMKCLRDAGAADFFWDIPETMQTDRPDIVDNDVILILAGLQREFPMPGNFMLKKPATVPSVTVHGISSAIGQAKEASNVLARWWRDGYISDSDINTAVIIPDQSLLTSLMLAMPEEIKKVNVTLSLPFVSTTFATLLRIIISLQCRARRKRDGRTTFFYKDVIEVLQHPHIRLIAAEDAEQIHQEIIRHRLYNIDAAELAVRHPALAYIFTTVESPDNIDSAYGYIENLVNCLSADLTRAMYMRGISSSLEVEVLQTYISELAELRDTIRHHDIEMGELTFFILFERLMHSTTLTLNGSPLSGLQVMGVLETRLLDFDNIIFLSMNERTFPRRNYINTMIPNNLRCGYGLDPIDRGESWHAYYFFRAISRATRVSLFYDTRPGRTGGGEMSRYISRLIYLHDKGNIVHRVVTNTNIIPGRRAISIAKTPEVVAELNRYLTTGDSRISASALKDYMKCPLSFYLTYVKGLREEDTPQGYMSAAMIGDTFHHSMLEILRPYEGKRITAATLAGIMNGDRIERTVKNEICRILAPGRDRLAEDKMNFEAALVSSSVSIQVRAVLDAERRLIDDSDYDGFTYIKGELDIKDRLWQVTDRLAINFRMQIDRVDRLDNGTLRFIDYKTGTDKQSVGEKIDNLFSGDHTRQGIFQLMLYAEAYADMTDNRDNINLSLYSLRDIMRTGEIKPLKNNRTNLEPYPAWHNEFRPKLEKLVTEIFDPNVPFTQCLGIDRCEFCKFRRLCGRPLPPKYS